MHVKAVGRGRVGRNQDDPWLGMGLPTPNNIAPKTAQLQITKAKALERTIGHLGHLSLVVPGAHYFLSRLQELQRIATHRQSIQINKPCQADLRLMLKFLENAKKGIDMNLIALRKPTHVY